MASNQDPVDGPKIAAKILLAMPRKDRERLLLSMDQVDEILTRKVRAKLFTFEDLATLSSQSAQRLPSEIDHKDLVLSLKTASDKVKEHLLRNMTDRRRTVVEQDLAALPPTRVSDVEAAQGRILARVEELRKQGLLRTEDEGDQWV